MIKTGTELFRVTQRSINLSKVLLKMFNNKENNNLMKYQKMLNNIIHIHFQIEGEISNIVKVILRIIVNV
jgi:hypothetical protein